MGEAAILVKWFQSRSLKMVDGRTPEHGYTISSFCEPDGSGELKMQISWQTVQTLVKVQTDFGPN